MGLHGNPQDYAWGPGGLDAIITQVYLVLVLFKASVAARISLWHSDFNIQEKISLMLDMSRLL